MDQVLYSNNLIKTMENKLIKALKETVRTEPAMDLVKVLLFPVMLFLR